MKLVLVIGMVLLLSAPVQAVWGHSLFNSAEEFFGGYRVQIATLPEFPQIGEDSQILLRVTDGDFEEVDRMTIGMRIFLNDDQIYAVAPTSVESSHFETVFVFDSPGTT